MKATPVRIVEQSASCVTFQTDSLRFRVHFLDEGVARVTVSADDAGGSEVDGPMLDGSRGLSQVVWRLQDDDESFRLSTARLALVIDKKEGSLSWYDGFGRLLSRNPGPAGAVLERVPLYGRDFDESDITYVQTVDGLKAKAGEGKERFLRNGYKARLSFEFQDGEAIYGLGQHEEGILDYRGKTQYLYQQNMKVALPVLVSSRGWGLLAHAYSLMIFRDDPDRGSYLWIDACDALDYFFVVGPEFDQIVASFRRLTGAASLPPRWAFGYIQSKERYVDAEELVSVADEFRLRGIPLDGIVLDWQSWPGKLWGQKSFDPERFPNPQSMTDELHRRGVKFMISIWPNMSGEGSDRLAMKERGFLLGNGSTYDAFSEEARHLYWTQAREGLYKHGVDAWWCDCTEPFEADWTGPVKPQVEERMVINSGAAKKFLDPSTINAYSLLHCAGIHEGQRAEQDGKRTVNLTRSAYPGQQRYGTFTWSGDLCATWDALAREIPDALNFCVSGLPYWTTDIGAFFVKNKEQWFWSGDYEGGVEDLGYRELFLRWLQFGTFLPMMRAHGTDTPREPWRFADEAGGGPFYEAILRFIRLRYRLLPYLYSLAARTYFDGYTLMRSLAFDFRGDAVALRVEDQFMLGSALLVCPVLEPHYYGPDSTPLPPESATRPVYLPDGTTWIDFWEGAFFDGGKTIDAIATLDRIPLYLRAGSILPMGVPVSHSSLQIDSDLELRVYPGADGCFTLYEDAGDGYGYQNGECSRIHWHWIEAERTLVIGERSGSYPEMCQKRRFSVRLMTRGLGQERLELSGQGVVAPLSVQYDGRELRVPLSE